MLPPLRNCFVFFGLVLLLAPLAASQQARSRPPLASADQEQIVPYWTTETGWKSELQLRNNQIGSDLTVTPVLRTAYGAETSLSAVTIKPQEVKAIDLDAAIGTTAPQLVGTYGSLVLRYRSPGSRSLYAALMVRNIGHPFAFHIDATGESQDLQAGSREGIWWLPKDTTSDYLILTNQGKITLPLDLSLYDANGRESKQKVLLRPSRNHAVFRSQINPGCGTERFVWRYQNLRRSARWLPRHRTFPLRRDRCILRPLEDVRQ